jgi:hypothetical protein
MRNLLFTLLDLAVATARLCGPGGVRAVIAEHLSSSRNCSSCAAVAGARPI